MFISMLTHFGNDFSVNTHSVLYEMPFDKGLDRRRASLEDTNLSFELLIQRFNKAFDGSTKTKCNFGKNLYFSSDNGCIDVFHIDVVAIDWLTAITVVFIVSIVTQTRIFVVNCVVMVRSVHILAIKMFVCFKFIHSFN